MTDTAPALRARGAEPDEAAAVDESAGRGGLWVDGWAQLRRRPLFWIASTLILVLLVMALWPSLFTSVDPRVADLALSGADPSPDAVLGRDLQGRDIYARAIHGAAPTLTVGLLASLGTVLVGAMAGLVAGYRGSWVDGLVSRVGEVFAGLPFILGGIVILTTFNQPGRIVGEVRIVTQVVLTIVVLSWPLAMRIMRAAALEISQQDYVKAARALGAGPLRIVGRHILPNTLAPVLVFATIQFGVFIGAEAALSFLGIGLRDPVVSWGVMISEAQERVADIPQALFFPAAFLVVAVLAFVMLGDAVRDAFDPRGR
ncbi:ABC transporter permease [Actinomycetospora cinnamomea]|uniref:Oligopeptide transport system permease protein n=1 Tax=Actinomycetospora cinnamomea TaxID=663609 RepID=A0A2U1F8T4_9PSEU|nr:ABC transporter permease [Actinomycetospora cinnamomea]PVZ08607.1 oligopeptide transport system permease protein [Actinomycetospora cinnamomea]